MTGSIFTASSAAVRTAELSLSSARRSAAAYARCSASAICVNAGIADVVSTFDSAVRT